MPLLGFQQRFAEAVESGAKRQTIRAYRKDGRDPKVGDRLYLYTGLRTKASRKLGEAVVDLVDAVTITDYGLCLGDDLPPMKIRLDIAKADGFRSEREMLEWFEKTHGLPFEGLLIRWGKIER